MRLNLNEFLFHGKEAGIMAVVIISIAFSIAVDKINKRNNNKRQNQK